MVDQHWTFGKVALVTGAGVRVGRCLAERLAQRGMDVAVHYRSSEDEAIAVATVVESHGVRAKVFQADFADGAPACRNLIDQVTEAMGPVAVLLNNASVFEPMEIADMEEGAWERTLRVNLTSPAFLCKEVAARLPKDERGHLIQLCDWRGTNPVPGHLAYTLSKAGLVAMTKLLAQELAPTFQVNGIAPGAILPPPDEGEEYLDVLATRNPLQRTGSPEQLADAMEYFLSSDFVTGEVLHVTGGEQL